MARIRNADWKLYFKLFLMFAPLTVMTVIYLPGDYKSLAMVWVFIFWICYHVLRLKKTRNQNTQKKHQP
ncbi:hypothetical protein [Staphylococcus intermedius]|uniref:Uncharacterized protein n=1 Tax=Staphylococcus intermedius NCTC 11048 TaxID=1141106 RepID=A0A380G4N4_STAIN|nr:hypothetical protein [Staphylococcus intermedius]PCF62861.1 hypothetical protein B5C04_11375 [Staphylococcus intermedius]PCF77973.1 hypothetical protein B4W74_11730 [Staphylococcus intermedius]PCF78325.1 hypothetical protein B4W70_11370 [Staphylococcus intermedius]PCF85298.1 hypothetical protein B4W76_10300 [Staphylococcus intermedius]PCF86121.1 hypothetical protein B4W75_11395 [Staphylococcus intermedius]